MTYEQCASVNFSRGQALCSGQGKYSDINTVVSTFLINEKEHPAGTPLFTRPHLQAQVGGLNCARLVCVTSRFETTGAERFQVSHTRLPAPHGVSLLSVLSLKRPYD